jgi:hypothetical protein
LLDIEFKNNDEKQMNGIELGKRLRGLYANDNTAIVYVTSYGEYAIDSIKIRPYDYIKKPITYERIVEFFETYYLDQAKRKKVFEYTAHKVKNSIIVSNICYFESQGRTIVIHTITNQYTFYGKLSNLLDNESLSDLYNVHKFCFLTCYYDTDGSVGAAKGAGIGAGIYKDHDEAFATLEKLQVIEPDEVHRKEYLHAYAEWKEQLMK